MLYPKIVYVDQKFKKKRAALKDQTNKTAHASAGNVPFVKSQFIWKCARGALRNVDVY